MLSNQVRHTVEMPRKDFGPGSYTDGHRRNRERFGNSKDEGIPERKGTDTNSKEEETAEPAQARCVLRWNGRRYRADRISCQQIILAA